MTKVRSRELQSLIDDIISVEDIKFKEKKERKKHRHNIYIKKTDNEDEIKKTSE